MFFAVTYGAYADWCAGLAYTVWAMHFFVSALLSGRCDSGSTVSLAMRASLAWEITQALRKKIVTIASTEAVKIPRLRAFTTRKLGFLGYMSFIME